MTSYIAGLSLPLLFVWAVVLFLLAAVGLLGALAGARRLVRAGRRPVLLRAARARRRYRAGRRRPTAAAAGHRHRAAARRTLRAADPARTPHTRTPGGTSR